MSSGSDRADQISLSHALTAANAYPTQMTVQRLEVIAMIDHDHIAITIVVPARVNNHTGVGGVHRFAFIACYVNSPVIGIWCVIEPRQIMFIGRPDKSPKPNSTAADRVTGAWTKHTCRGWILACHTKRRAPRDELTMTARYHQPCSGRNIGVRKVTDCGRIQFV